MGRAACNSPGRARSRAKSSKQEQPPIASEQVHTASRARPAAPEHLMRARRSHVPPGPREAPMPPRPRALWCWESDGKQ
jgi:hypothetical protein